MQFKVHETTFFFVEEKNIDSLVNDGYTIRVVYLEEEILINSRKISGTPFNFS